MQKRVYLILVVLMFSVLLVFGCTQPAPTPAQQTAAATPVPTLVTSADTVKLGDSSLGKVLTDAKGMTLYYFTTDIPSSGASTCYSAFNCSKFWPIFSVDNLVVSSPLEASDFSSITRTDGTRHTTYYGWPLYYFQKDTKPGDVLGEGVLKTWYVAKPDYSVMITSTPKLGSYLTDESGKTLYVFNKDSTGTSTCTGACLAKWPAYYSAAINAPSLLKTSDFGTVSRADGVNQSSYMGRPLYYYSGDNSPGMTTGEGFNNVWYVANITGVAPVVTTPPMTVQTTVQTLSPSGGGSSSGGGGY